MSDIRAVRDDAWKRGYDACREGKQRHSPYAPEKVTLEVPAEVAEQMHAGDVGGYSINGQDLEGIDE